MNLLAIFLGFFLLIIGFSIMIIGWKIHRQMIGLSGFIAGTLIGNFTYTEILGQDFLGIQIVLVPLIGILFLMGFLIYERWALAITGGVVGALVISGFTSTRILVDWSANIPIFAPHYNYVALLTAFIIFSYLSHRYFKLGYIFLSTCIGSVLVAYGGVGMGAWNYDHLGLFLLLSMLIGVIKQLYNAGEMRDHQLLIQEYKYCTICGKELTRRTLQCPNCGKSMG